MKKYVVIFFLLGTVLMAVVMSRTGAPLRTPLTPHGILDLEFAYNKSKTDSVVNTWASINAVDTLSAAKWNTELDFIFIIFYSIFLFLAAGQISRKFGGAFGRAGKYISKGALVAGFLDVLENTGMLLTLSGNGSGAIAFCTAFCSVIKWGLAILAVLYILTGTVSLLRAKFLR